MKGCEPMNWTKRQTQYYGIFMCLLGFADWLMENCELSEDNTIWSYDSEDYTNEKLFEIFNVSRNL